MTEGALVINFGGHGDRYEPGDTLTAHYQLERLNTQTVRAIELSVLWHTEGKGDEDIGVHLFRRQEVRNDDAESLAHAGVFSTVLPKSPLSYEGAIVKVRWCVRARAFLSDGKELMHERRFYMGDVKAVQASVAHEPTQVLLY